jgi:hypothetical protein
VRAANKRFFLWPQTQNKYRNAGALFGNESFHDYHEDIIPSQQKVISYVCQYKLWLLFCISWLRHCVTSRKFAGLILDEVIGLFNLPNSFVRTIALESTQPLTENEYQESSWG